MANLVAMNMKRKDVEVANHGLSIFLDPKRIKLQDGEIPEMMEEERPFAVAPTATVPIMASWVLPPQGQEAVHESVNTASGSKSSEPPFSADQATTAAPMDVETDVRQCQPQEQPYQRAPYWSGFF